jgi:hypothetical protein
LFVHNTCPDKALWLALLVDEEVQPRTAEILPPVVVPHHGLGVQALLKIIAEAPECESIWLNSRVEILFMEIVEDRFDS